MSSRDPARVPLALALEFFLGIPIERPKYVQIKIANIPQEFVYEYNLHKFSKDSWTYFEITNGVYGLSQSGILANTQLRGRLGESGYF